MFIVKALVCITLVGLFIYTKLLPHKNLLNPSYRKIFNFFYSIFNPLLRLLRKGIKPAQLGPGLALDMAQLVLFLVLLLVLIVL